MTANHNQDCGNRPVPAGDVRQAVRGAFVRLANVVTGQQGMALIDQAVVSCTSFVTMIVVARASNAESLGLYALATSLLLPCVSIQDSLITLPYTICRHRTAMAPRDHAGGFLMWSAGLSLVVMLVFGLGAIGLSVGSAGSDLIEMALVLLAIVPFALLRDFGRRFEFAHLEMGRALILDIAAAVLQIAALCLLARRGSLSPSSAFVAIGMASAVAGFAWLRSARGHFSWRPDLPRAVAAEGWDAGKWLFATQITLSLQIYATYWLLGLIAGFGATGVYAACASLAMMANPLLIGLSNVIAPQGALALKQGGLPLLRREVQRNTSMLVAAMVAFCVLVLVGGKSALAVVFPNQDLTGHTDVLVVLSLGMLATAAGMPSSKGLAVMDQPRAVFGSGLLALVVTVVLVTLLASSFGLTGAAVGVLLGNLTGSIARCWGFAALTQQPVADRVDGRDARRRAQVVMAQWLPDGGPDPWIIESMGGGYQADVVTVRRQDGRPVWQDEARVVVKLYKPNARATPSIVRRQSTAFTRFHEALNGTTVRGWRFAAPRPLYTCEQPLALVITLVDGTPFDKCLRGAPVGGDIAIAPVAFAVVTTLQRCWSRNLAHGDLNLDNILCNSTDRQLSFVDVGLPEDHVAGAEPPWPPDPASQDLAYLLFDAAVQIKSTIGSGSRHRVRLAFAMQALRVALGNRPTTADKLALLDSIVAASSRYLGDLEASWSSPRGVWCHIVRRVAARRIAAAVATLRAEVARAPDVT